MFYVLVALKPSPLGAEIAAGVNGVAAGAEFSGTFTLQRFVDEAGRLLAVGVLTNVPGLEATSAKAIETIRIPVSSISRSCQALRVDLASIDVDVQGRAVHVNEFAVQMSDAGNGPLRQSLCDVANAPDDTTTLVPMLNDLVHLVGCLMRGAQRCARQST